MAKVKKDGAKNAAAPILSKLGKKTYTKGQLLTHLATAVSAQGFGEVSKKQAGAFIEELATVLFTHAVVGAPLPGLGKLVLRTSPAKPARTIIMMGKEHSVPAKPKSHKLVFRFSKDAKARIAK